MEPSSSRGWPSGWLRAPSPPPPNDDFANSAAFTTEPHEFGALLASATLEEDEPRAQTEAVGSTAWWHWTASTRGTARIDVTEPATPPLLGVYERGPWDDLVPVKSSATEFGNECVRFRRARVRLEWDTNPGTTYFVQADAFPDFDRTRPFRARFTFVPAPANDRLTSPTVLEGTDWSGEVTNDGATRTPEEPAGPGWAGSSSVWLRWVLPGRGLVQVTTNEPVRFAEPGVEILPLGGGGSFGGEFTWTAGPCSGAFEDLNPIPPFAPVFALFQRQGTAGDLPLLAYRTHGTNEVWGDVDGTELWIGLDGPGEATGTARLNARLTPPPSNDLRSARIRLPSTAVRVTGRTAGAGVEPGDVFPNAVTLPPGTSQTPRRSVWWEWQAPSAGTWILEPVVGVYDHGFVVFRDEPSAASIPAAATFGAPATFNATAGETLQIGVLGIVGFGGNVEFRIVPLSVPRLLPPVVMLDDQYRLVWIFNGLAGWRHPFVVETSADLRHWTVANAEWFQGSDTLRVRLDPEIPALFARFRAGP